MHLLKDNDNGEPILNDDFGEETDIASEDEFEERNGNTKIEQEGKTNDDGNNASTSLGGGELER